MRAALGFFLVVAVLGVLVYAGARHNPFQYDDRHSIEYNPHIRSLENLPRFFTDLHTFSSDSRGTMFRPLLLLTYALNYQVSGQGVEGYHWVNLFLHVLFSTLLFALLYRLTGSRAAAWVAGVLFFLHPAHAELVNYLSSRSDLLVSCLYLGALLLVVEGRWAGGARSTQAACWPRRWPSPCRWWLPCSRAGPGAGSGCAKTGGAMGCWACSASLIWA